MPNKWCVLFYWSLVCLDIPGEFFFSRLVAKVRQQTVSELALEEEDITAANEEENCHRTAINFGLTKLVLSDSLWPK